MYRAGHLGFNAFLYAPFVPLVTRTWSLEVALFGAVLVVGVSTLPDIDGYLPRIRHRGPTHTIWFAVLVGLLVGIGTTLVVHSTPGMFSFGFVVGTCGVLAHLAGDVVTPMGISPFAPLSERRVTLNWFASKNGRINRTVLAVGATALVLSVLLTVDQATYSL